MVQRTWQEQYEANTPHQSFPSSFHVRREYQRIWSCAHLLTVLMGCSWLVDIPVNVDTKQGIITPDDLSSISRWCLTRLASTANDCTWNSAAPRKDVNFNKLQLI